MQKKETLFILVILVLVAAAGVIGYVMYSGNGLESATLSEVQNGGESVEDRDARASVLNPPAADATEAEARAHFDLAARLATEAEYLDIANCEIKPVVLGVKHGGQVAFRNLGNKDHTITFSEDRIYSLLQGSTLAVTADFAFDSGTYWYWCDENPQIAGILLVTP